MSELLYQNQMHFCQNQMHFLTNSFGFDFQGTTGASWDFLTDPGFRSNETKKPHDDEIIRVFPKIGVPKNGWFISWKTLLKWMFWGYPYFWKHPSMKWTCTWLGSPPKWTPKLFFSKQQQNPTTPWHINIDRYSLCVQSISICLMTQ